MLDEKLRVNFKIKNYEGIKNESGSTIDKDINNILELHGQKNIDKVFRYLKHASSYSFARRMIPWKFKEITYTYWHNLVFNIFYYLSQSYKV